MRRVPRPDPSPALPAQTPRPSVSHESDLSDKSRASLACASPAVSIDHLPLPPLDDLDLPDLVGEGPDDVLGDLAFDALPGVPVACFDDATFPTPGDAQHPHGGGETTDSGVRSAADAAAETQSSDETARRGDRGPAASASADDEKQRERLVRNRESAQQSRQRKKQYLDDLERRCRALSRANGELHRACASLVAECNGLRHHLALATGKPPVPPGVVLPHPTPPEIRALAAEAGPAKIPLFPQNAAPGNANANANANAAASPHPTRVAPVEEPLEGCVPPLQDPTASSKPSSSASGSAPGSPESAAKRRRKMPAGFAGDNNKKTASVAAVAAGAMGALACVACVAGLRGASEPRGARMIAAGSSLATLRSAPATTHRRRLLEDAADSDAFGFAARESFSREGDSAAAGRTIPPLPLIASPGLRRLSALRGGAYASEADGSGDFESGRSDSDSDSDSDSPYAVATLAGGGGGGGSAMARSTRWWGDFGGGDADDLGNLGGSAADPTEEEDTAYAGENDPWYAAFRAAGMSRADLLSRLSCDRVFRFQPAEGGLRSAAFAARLRDAAAEGEETRGGEDDEDRAVDADDDDGRDGGDASRGPVTRTPAALLPSAIPLLPASAEGIEAIGSEAIGSEAIGFARARRGADRSAYTGGAGAYSPASGASDAALVSVLLPPPSPGGAVGDLGGALSKLFVVTYSARDAEYVTYGCRLPRIRGAGGA